MVSKQNGSPSTVALNIGPTSHASSLYHEHDEDDDTSKKKRQLFGLSTRTHQVYHLMSSLLKELLQIIKHEQAKNVPYLSVFLLASCIILMACCHKTNSLALFSYSFLLLFDVLSLFTVLLTVWVSFQPHSAVYSFGYEVFEVYMLFCSSVLSIVGSLFVTKEALERLFQQPEVSIDNTYYLFGICMALLCHLSIYYLAQNRALRYVLDSATSNSLQEHFSDISNSICGLVPVLSQMLLPRVSSIPLLSWFGVLLLTLNYLIISNNESHILDSLISIIFSLVVVVTMAPLMTFSGHILLQTTPKYLTTQLDKCLREASTLDGVLEFRGEHFWTVSFGKLAGFLQVRVRRDADEQLVLAHITHKLSDLVSSSNLTVHLFKDDKLISSTPQHQLSSSSPRKEVNVRSPRLNSNRYAPVIVDNVR